LSDLFQNFKICTNGRNFKQVATLLQVSFLAALGTLNTAIINPAYVPLGTEFGVGSVVASYQTTVVIALNGVGPFLWVPLANKYGRRPVYVFTTLLGFVSALACGFTNDFTQLLICRVFNGLFPSAMALGAITVVDMFFIHQRYGAAFFPERWASRLMAT
jgi:MFS family permease